MTLPDSMFLGERQDRLHTALRCIDNLMDEVETEALYAGDTLPGQVELPFIEKLVTRMMRLALALEIHRQGHARIS